MAFVVRSGERRFRVDPRTVDAGEREEHYLVLLDEVQRRLSLTRLSPAHMSILMDNRSYSVEVEREGGGSYRVSVEGEVFTFSVFDEYMQLAEEEAGSGEAHITAPMPGLVARVMVSEGDEVEAGQGLLVLEAMKMQNEIPAPGAGTVVSLPVREGGKVMTGDTLAVIE